MVMFALPALLQLEPTSTRAVRVGALAVLPSALIVVVEAFLYGAERNPVVAGINAGESVLRIGLVAAALHRGWGAPGAVAVFAAGRWAGLLVELWAASRTTGVLPIWPGIRACIDYGRSGLAFGFNTLVQATLFRGDLVLLSKIVGEASFGIFYAGFRLVEVAMLLPAAANSSVYPTASRLWQASHVQARDTVEWAATMIMAVTLPICLVLVLEGPFVLSLLFPAAFIGSASTMGVLAVTLVPHVVGLFGGMLLYAAHRQKLASVVVAINGVTAILLNVLLVTRLGGLGTALSRLGWFSLAAALLFVITARLGVPLRPQRILGAPLLALVPAALILFLLHAHPWLGIPAALATYAAGLALVGLAGPGPLRLRPEAPTVAASGRAAEELAS
jgi:O-antigen/teichoic acid export membrane protein